MERQIDGQDSPRRVHTRYKPCIAFCGREETKENMLSLHREKLAIAFGLSIESVIN